MIQVRDLCACALQWTIPSPKLRFQWQPLRSCSISTLSQLKVCCTITGFDSNAYRLLCQNIEGKLILEICRRVKIMILWGLYNEGCVFSPLQHSVTHSSSRWRDQNTWQHDVYSPCHTVESSWSITAMCPLIHQPLLMGWQVGLLDSWTESTSEVAFYLIMTKN